jgi:integrase
MCSRVHFLRHSRQAGRALIEIDGDVRSQPRICGPSTQRRIFATLRAALNAAVKQRKITWNPCAGIELAPENASEPRRWTPQQARTFITHVAGDPLGLMYRVMVLKGVRRGELCGLRWCDVSPDCRVLNISQTVLQLGGKVVMGTPKTRASVRRVYLGPETAELLKAHRDAQPARIGPGGRDGTGLRSASRAGSRGSPITSASALGAWRPRLACRWSSCTRVAGTRATA